MNQHACPGCGKQTANYLFACYSCWERLPDRLQKRVKDTARLNMLTDQRMQAISDAVSWYGEQHVVGSD